MSELCSLAEKYGSDKAPSIQHTYTPYYYELFSPIRNNVKKVLEIGIGNARYRNKIKDFNPVLGASLKMWRDFFPNAQVYGIDIDPDTMFKDERIETFVCDQSDPEALKELIKKIGDVDIVIDDGSHHPIHQIVSCQTLMPLLKKEAIYIIEDVRLPDHVMNGLKEFDCSIPAMKLSRHNRLILVKHK